MKRILIVYSPTGDLSSHVEKEFMWQKIMSGYIGVSVVREISTKSKKLVEFEDGTVVEMVQAGDMLGRRFTHLYVSETLVKMNPSFIDRLAPCFLPFAKNKNERTIVFNFVNGKGLDTRTYKGE